MSLSVGNDFSRLGSDHTIPVEQRCRQQEWGLIRFTRVEITAHFQLSILAENIDRFRKDVFYESWIDEAKWHIAVNATERQVVDDVSERWNVFTLGGIDFDAEQVVTLPIQMRRQLKRKGRVAAAVLTESLSVDPNSGGRHHAAKVDEDSAPLQLSRQTEVSPVDGDDLVLLIVEAMPRQHLVRMGDRYAFERKVVKARLRRVGKILFAEEPIVIQWIDAAGRCQIILGEGERRQP